MQKLHESCTNRQVVVQQATKWHKIQFSVIISLLSLFISGIAVWISIRTYTITHRPYIGVTEILPRIDKNTASELAVEFRLANTGNVPAAITYEPAIITLSQNGQEIFSHTTKRPLPDQETVTLLPNDSLWRELELKFTSMLGTVIECPPLPIDGKDQSNGQANEGPKKNILFVEGVGCIEVHNMTDLILSGKAILEMKVPYSYEWRSLLGRQNERYTIRVRLEDSDKKGRPYFRILSSGNR